MKSSWEQLEPEVRSLVDRYRTQCLWFLRADLYPDGPEQAVRFLRYIEQHGDREGFVHAARIRQWLSPTHASPTAASE